MLLGIDQGTTGTRACLVDDDLTIVRSAYAQHMQHTPRPGWVEHDPAEIWACTQRVIAEVLATGERVEGVALANQGETVMLWDARTGEPVQRALVWQDTRTEPMMARHAKHAMTSATIRDKTGLQPDAYFSASKLTWLLDQPGVRAIAASGYLRAGTIDTWLIDRLTRGEVFATDASTAARTLLCETRGCTWSQDLLDLFDTPRGILAEIRDSDADFGACLGNGLDGVPILASLVDQPAAMLGQGCVDRGDVKATFGTGCFVYANAGTTRPDKPAGTLSTVAWRRGGETTYALDGGVLAVGSALRWAEKLGLPVDETALASGGDAWEVGSGAGTVGEGPICVPALVGLGAPHWDRIARGAWFGLSAATTGEQLVGALAEGLACRVVEVVRAVERDSGLAIDVLRADGGLTRSAALMQRTADLLGIAVEVASEEEATAVGACALAALKLGRITIEDVRRRRARGQARYEPRVPADQRATRLDRFDRALALARQWR
ncbi:MAG: glycerol kinase [Deltaproteobacteria bacterium]|nr:glycerol kinase [Deltaproteobacteria bacterium]